VSRPKWMNVIKVAMALMIAAAGMVPMPTAAADDEGGRKVIQQVTPIYPEVARRMRLSGQVRLEVTVLPDGKVKAVKALGGHPLLVSAAEDAIKRWKFEPGSESKELRTFNFKPLE
jgi:TonB family protein